MINDINIYSRVFHAFRHGCKIKFKGIIYWNDDLTCTLNYYRLQNGYRYII